MKGERSEVFREVILALLQKEKAVEPPRPPIVPIATPDRVAHFYQDRMARRVAGKFMFTAALHDELVRKMTQLFSGSGEDAGEVAQWFKSHFRFDSPKTPQGQKDLKTQASKLHWFLQDAAPKKDYQGNVIPGNPKSLEEAERIWKAEVGRLSGDLVRYFTDEGGKIVPAEVQAGSTTYVNAVGFDQKKLGQYVTAIEAVLASVRGWRRKALTGGVRVVLAGPKEFRGTATGTYRSSEDTLYIRATPNVLKRAGGTYGSVDFIVVHELGHRFERKGRVPVDFDQPEWITTPYSRKEGEGFAELFALSNFGMQGTWGAVLDKFEAVMSGHGVDANSPETRAVAV